MSNFTICAKELGELTIIEKSNDFDSALGLYEFRVTESPSFLEIVLISDGVQIKSNKKKQLPTL
jgi:hypothetical protein